MIRLFRIGNIIHEHTSKETIKPISFIMVDTKYERLYDKVKKCTKLNHRIMKSEGIVEVIEASVDKIEIGSEIKVTLYKEHRMAFSPITEIIDDNIILNKGALFVIDDLEYERNFKLNKILK